MDVSRHIVFSEEDIPNLLSYLEQNKIPHTNSFAVIFDILESNAHWADICELLSQKKAITLCQTIFSPQELDAAEWLSVRSVWLNGYPQPMDEFSYRRITYTEEDYCPECGCGLHQVAPFRLRSQPKWGRRHFMSLNWVSDELFVDDIAKNVLSSSGLTGFHFSCVHNKNGTAEFPEAHQLCIEAVTQSGIVEGRGDFREVIVCPLCGIRKLHPNGIGMHAFHKEAFDGMPDVCKSIEYFGWGRAGHPLILVRQKMYQTIINNHLGIGLEFEPVELV